MIEIDGLVVCENYSDYLCQCIENWKKSLRSILVVTSNRDIDTHNLVEMYELDIFKTDVFWERNAKFNKGAAISQAYNSRQWDDWVLFFDADIKPPDNIASMIGCPIVGNLYGANRVLENGEKINESEIVGAFSLFHSSDKNAKIRPIVDVHWSHCGNYDSRFQGRWDADRKIKLPIEVTHLGAPFENWCGRGNAAAMKSLWEKRARNRGYAHEKIK